MYSTSKRPFNRGRKNPSTILGLLGMAVFTGNILIGKYRLLTGTGTAAPLDGVPEFLILSLSIALFAVSLVAAEKQEALQQEET